MKNIFFRTIVILSLFSCSGPMYEPKDLTNDSDYQQLLEPTKIKDRTNYFSINDEISLYYFTKGKGEKVLVIHGGPGYPFNQAWKGLDNLTSNYEFYYYHQRGCGKSTRPFDKFESSNFYKNSKFLNKKLGLPAQIADIEQIRRKLGQDKITLIGHSFGGFLATLYAIEFPEHTKSLILVSPAELVKMPAKSGGLYELVKDKLKGKNRAEYDEYLDKFFDYGNLFDKSEKQLVKENLEFIKYYDLATGKKNEGKYTEKEVGGWIQHACFLSMGKKHDYSEYLKEIKCPTLVIHGKEDLMPISSTTQYLNYIPKSKLKIIDNASHFSFNEKPNEFGEIVKVFLKKNK